MTDPHVPAHGEPDPSRRRVDDLIAPQVETAHIARIDRVPGVRGEEDLAHVDVVRRIDPDRLGDRADAAPGDVDVLDAVEDEPLAAE